MQVNEIGGDEVEVLGNPERTGDMIEVIVAAPSRDEAVGIDAQQTARNEAEKAGLTDPVVYVKQSDSVVYNKEEGRYEKKFTLQSR